MPALRERRLAHEWEALQQFKASSPGRLTEIDRAGDEAFLLTVAEMPALCHAPGDDWASALCNRHSLKILFPRYYPAMPCEIYLSRPVFHPNVDEVNGFVCLWNRYSTAYTSLHALTQLAAILAWRLMNTEAIHLLQPTALDWYNSTGQASEKLPLSRAPWIELPGLSIHGRPSRRRLS
jgi:ubiquitin-protein ligase